MKALVCLVTVMTALAPAKAIAQAPAPQDQAPFGISGIRLASFSPQRAFSESAEGKAGIARLAALQEKRAREIEERNKSLQAQEQTLQRSLAVLSEDARSQRTKEVEKFKLDVQRFIEDAQAELLGERRDIENAFVLKLQPAIQQVAKEKRVHVVVSLDDPSIVWADPSLDITADVVKQLARAEAPALR